MSPEPVHPIEPLALPVAAPAMCRTSDPSETFVCVPHTKRDLPSRGHSAFVKRTPLRRPETRSPERCFFPGDWPKLATAQGARLMWINRETLRASKRAWVLPPRRRCLAPFRSQWIPADFRLRVIELGPRSHPHSEEWMCFFGPDASFRDLQRPTASHGHAPACPILARCEGMPHDQRLGGVVALSSIRRNQPRDRFVRTHLDHHSETRGYPARRPGSRPSPLRPEDRSPPPLSHDGDMAVARAGQPREKAKRVHAETFVSLRDRSEAPEGVAPFDTSPAMACAVQSLLDSLPSPSCRA